MSPNYQLHSEVATATMLYSLYTTDEQYNNAMKFNPENMGKKHDKSSGKP